MKTLGEKLGIKKRELVIRQPKGAAQTEREIRIWTKRGYVLESQQPQGRKRVLLTFRLKDEDA